MNLSFNVGKQGRREARTDVLPGIFPVAAALSASCKSVNRLGEAASCPFDSLRLRPTTGPYRPADSWPRNNGAPAIDSSIAAIDRISRRGYIRLSRLAKLKIKNLSTSRSISVLEGIPVHCLLFCLRRITGASESESKTLKRLDDHRITRSE